MIECTCPHCGQAVTLPEDRRGRSAVCPQCDKPMEVPAGSGERAGSSGRGLVSLILGAVSVLLPLLGLLTGLVAVIFGVLGLRDKAGRGLAIGGIVLGAFAWVAQVGAVAVLLPMLTEAKAKARAAVCKTNLRAVAMAMEIYSVENSDSYPGFPHPAKGWASRWDADPVQGDGDRFGQWRAANAGSNLQQYWLLVKVGCLQEGGVLSCPEDEGFVAVSHAPGAELGFSSWRNCSYAFQPATRGGGNEAWLQRHQQSFEMAIAGDRLADPDAAAGGAEALDAAPHGGSGWSYARLDGSVHSERKTGHAAGWKGNNIYTIDVNRSGRVVPGLGQYPSGDEFPEHLNDSVLPAK